MLLKRIFLTSLVTAVIAISATATPVRSTGRKPWPGGGSVNTAVLAVPDQEVERARIAEMQIESHEPKKTAIVGSWLITLSNGNKVVASYTSDGIAIGSSQGDVSLAPGFPTSTAQHGAWVNIGGRQFAVTLVAVGYDAATGESLGLLKIHLLLTVNENGDQFSGTAKLEIFDTGGNPAGSFSFPIQGTRIKVEPFN